MIIFLKDPGQEGDFIRFQIAWRSASEIDRVDDESAEEMAVLFQFFREKFDIIMFFAFRCVSVIKRTEAAAAAAERDMDINGASGSSDFERGQRAVPSGKRLSFFCRISHDSASLFSSGRGDPIHITSLSVLRARSEK